MFLEISGGHQFSSNAKKTTLYKLINRNKGANDWIKVRLVYSRRRWAKLFAGLYARYENRREKLLAVLAQQYRRRSVLAVEAIVRRRLHRQFNDIIEDDMLKNHVGEFVGM